VFIEIIKEVRRPHRGRVELDSALGKGSAFTLVLPAGEH
jgi:signal transduction histidine kinase